MTEKTMSATVSRSIPKTYTETEVEELMRPIRQLGFDALPSGWVNIDAWGKPKAGNIGFEHRIPTPKQVGEFATGVKENLTDLFVALKLAEKELRELKADMRGFRRIMGTEETVEGDGPKVVAVTGAPCTC